MARTMLSKMAGQALGSLEGRASPWAMVRGPAAAFVASAWRLGWTVYSAFAVRTDEGDLLELHRDPPARIQREVQAAVWRWRWRRIESKNPTLVQGNGGLGAHIGPVFRLLKSSAVAEEWGPKQKGGHLLTL